MELTVSNGVNIGQIEDLIFWKKLFKITKIVVIFVLEIK